MGLLAPVSAHAGHSAQPPIDASDLKSDCICEALREAAGRHVHADNVCNLDGSKPSLKRPMSNDSSAQQACNVKTNIEPFFTTIYKPALINPRHEAKNAVNEWQRRAADVFHA